MLLDPSAVKRSHLIKAGAHTVTFSNLEQEVMHKTIRATTLSQNKVSMPTPCPLIAAESRWIKKQNWVSTQIPPWQSPSSQPFEDQRLPVPEFFLSV